MNTLTNGNFIAEETSKDVYNVYAKFGIYIGQINLNNEKQYKHSRNSEAMNINAHFMVRREHNQAILSLMSQARKLV